ncbi:hypothetical protein K491DRAFT_645314 [Lophiostoma macrostomum CBS 122681]|uniref:DUF2415 domain-containing protein n=1 Tax=Lophiostoma macrostomum CBS 122681 TaxID=1314788 RepID=A0A6A6TUU0_9PLEO|nr:hypothetical protein K491DRAFT_645314 [Lophiostoma macrostomum CBS 122681]
MAVDQEPSLSRDTDTFVLPPKAYYPLKIPINHYQLRHFVSSPEQDLIYYASAFDVYCLNAATRTQALVTTLPWEARCTASGHGYVCVGGEDDGNFAAIKVAGFPPVDPSDVDALLPIDLGTRVPRPPLLGAAHRVRLEKIGENIVNSISIHKFAGEGEIEDEVVAVLTNNDKTVRIYSLTWNLEIAVLDLPSPMNHATISPDGQLLVAVGDSNQCFFFGRTKTQKSTISKTPTERVPSSSPEWFLFEEVRLYNPPNSTVEGYFTTAWSPSGRLCAVGSECGYITVFDVELLRVCEYGEDAIIQLLSSTRPDVALGPGAVRTMQFSPAPWDLLIWSEDQARVCVADIRTGMQVKQVLTLDPKEEGLEKVEIADFDLTLSPEMQDLRREADFIRRYRRALDSEGTAAAVNFATDYIEASSERRRLHRQLGVVESDNDPHGLTAHERQILEALRTTRQREEGREQEPTPRSINYNTPGIPEARRQREAATRRNMGEALTEFMFESNRLAEQAATHLDNTHGPRRRASVILSNEGSGSRTDPPPNITDSATTRSPNPIPAHARRVDAQIVSSTDEAWRTIEEALARNVRSTETARSTASPEQRTDLRRLRQLTQMRERLRNAREVPDAYTLSGMGSRYQRGSRIQYDPSFGVRTAGLAISQDGRHLYCATEEGIFEFQINLHARKGFPAITPR